MNCSLTEWNGGVCRSARAVGWSKRRLPFSSEGSVFFVAQSGNLLCRRLANCVGVGSSKTHWIVQPSADCPSVPPGREQINNLGYEVHASGAWVRATRIHRGRPTI